MKTTPDMTDQYRRERQKLLKEQASNAVKTTKAVNKLMRTTQKILAAQTKAIKAVKRQHEAMLKPIYKAIDSEQRSQTKRQRAIERRLNILNGRIGA